MAARNGRWEITPPARILNLPQRSRRSRAAAPQEQRLDWKLGEHLDQGSATPPPSPLTWGMSSGETVGDSSGEERWRFQAEILRAECNFLRMEREVVLRKLERNRAQMEVTLKSAMETLVSGRKKIDGRASVAAALDEGIEELEEKLQELKSAGSSSRRRSTGGSRKPPRGSCRRNFDRQASVLRLQLEKMEEESSVKDIREISVQAFAKKDAEAERHEQEENATPGSSHSRRSPDEVIISTIKASTVGSAINASHRYKITCFLIAVYPDLSCIDGVQVLVVEEKMEQLSSCCSCKEVIGRIVQQVRTESEQWSEMQEMLEQVRVEMEELRSSRNHWQRRAIASEINFHSQHARLEWKQRARSCERKVMELQKVVKELQRELQPSKTRLLNAPPSTPLQSQLHAADSRKGRSVDAYKEKEKHVLVCHLKSQADSSRRSPLQVIDNMSPLLRPRSRVIDEEDRYIINSDEGLRQLTSIWSRSSREVGRADGNGVVKDRGLGSYCGWSHRQRRLRHKHDCGRGKKKQTRPILLLQHLSLQQGVAREAQLRQREEKQRRPMLLLQHLSSQQGVATGDDDAVAKQR
ncbi:hypothetical protein BHM03_00023849 [Ensete ventricosum]|nr:hypothetical protein BHM03_00023849 [Ensete ventricosum]